MPSTLRLDFILLLLFHVITWHVCVDCDRYLGSTEMRKFLNASKIVKK